MKRIALKLILAAVFLLVPMSTAYADSEITVTVDGSLVRFDQPPIIMNSRTMVPFRAVGEALGAKVYWDETTKTVEIFQDSKNITLIIGSNELSVNGKVATVMDSPAAIVNNRTLIPIRYVSEALDCKVDWDGSLRRAAITTEEYAKIQAEIEASKQTGYVDPKEYVSTGEYGTNFDKVAGGYYTNKQGFRIEEADYNDMLEKRKQIYAQVIKSGMSEFDKIKAIHDWVCKNITYNYSYYNNKKTWKPTKYQSEHQTAWAGLILGTAVCAGYSDAFQFLLDGLGIENHYIRGDVSPGGGHAWSIVKLDGNYYQVDTTWDSGSNGTVTYGYFLISDSAIENGTRRRTWETSKYPKCPQNYKWTIPVYNYVMVSTNNSKFGTVTADPNQATQGEEVNISAETNSGYVFDHWEVTTNGVTLSSTTSPNASFTMPNSSVSIKAYFKDPSATYKVTASENFPAYARASASPDWAKEGDAVNLSVNVTNTKYVFERWDVLPISGDIKLSDINSPNASFTMPANAVYIRAILKPAPEQTYAVTVDVDNSAFGTASIKSGSPSKGVRITLSATPTVGYAFDYWEVVSGSITLSDKNSQNATFIMPGENVSLKAYFKQAAVVPEIPAAEKRTVTVSENDASYGKATANPNETTKGAAVRLSATPNSGYAFDNWEVISGNVTIANKNASSVSFAMPDSDVSIKANFRKLAAAAYSITTSVNNSSYGTAAADSASSPQGASISLSATPKDGYEFDYWEVLAGSAFLSNKNSSSAVFTMPAGNVSVKAHFKKQPEQPIYYVMTITYSDGSIVVTPQRAKQGETVTITAIPKSGYEFVNWNPSLANLNNANSATTTFVMPNYNVTVSANFKAAEPSYRVAIGANNGGTASASVQTSKAGETVQITASAQEGYEFDYWSVIDGGVTISDIHSQSASFTMQSRDVYITAFFKQAQSAGNTSE